MWGTTWGRERAMSLRNGVLLALVSFHSCASLVLACPVPEQKITAFDGAASDEYGISVSISGDVAIVGS